MGRLKASKQFLTLIKKSIPIIAVASFLLMVVLVYSKQNDTKLIFVGDINFDRYIREVVNEKGGDFIFSCMGDVLKSADLVIGNLEGPITDNPSVSTNTEVGSPANYIFTFPTTTARLLQKYNIKLVNIGNNHIYNFQKQGLLSTKDYLKKSGINYIGGLRGDEAIYRTKLAGTKISFISYNQFGGDVPEKVAEKISKENKEGRFVIVYAHWGEEYNPVTYHQRNTAKLFSQSGAKIIIGSHPHVISPSEKVGDTLVYYSLGNFIFDQYWSSEVRTGLVLEIYIKNGQTNASEKRVILGRDGRTCLAKN